ncbi:MAG TPA: histidinol dehydrogenase [Phycisphaeraceae bacterium]
MTPESAPTAAPELPVFDLSTPAGKAGLDERLRKLRATASASSEAAQAVARIVADVREQGDEALVRYMRQWTDPDFTHDRIRVTQAELDQAHATLDPALREAIATAIEQVRAYQQHILPRPVKPIRLGGAELGLRFIPVDSAGLCVPGGTAVLFSTLIMLAVPAQVAGVDPKHISVVHPPPTRRAGEPARDISPIVLAACRMLDISNVYRLGGAQAVAALAYGTQSVEPVDLIAGPGNIYVQLAKAQVNGVTGTDNGFYGPSEIVTIADESAHPARVASDLIAQAEHDPGKCFLIAWSGDVIQRINEQVQQQIKHRRRIEAIAASLVNESAAILVKDQDQAVEIANTLACEHLNLAVADPDAWLLRIRHAGEVFLGDTTPVAAGDYYAGPSHCLPTGTTARFASGVSAYTFLKRMGTVAYRGPMPEQAVEHIARMAEAEGLDGHAQSVRFRRG